MGLTQFLSTLNAFDWADPMLAAFNRFQINTPNRREMFLAQTMYESNLFRRLEENLHYKAAMLMALFPSHFSGPADAQAVAARGPEAVANRIYANRMGNGTEASGDGWKYRGRGLIQLTGKANYAAAARTLGIPLIDQPDILLHPNYVILAAASFWAANGCNELADTGDFVGITKKINGGLLGLADRRAMLTRVQDAKLTV